MEMCVGRGALPTGTYIEEEDEVEESLYSNTCETVRYLQQLTN